MSYSLKASSSGGSIIRKSTQSQQHRCQQLEAFRDRKHCFYGENICIYVIVPNLKIDLFLCLASRITQGAYNKGVIEIDSLSLHSTYSQEQEQ